MDIFIKHLVLLEKSRSQHKEADYHLNKFFRWFHFYRKPSFNNTFLIKCFPFTLMKLLQIRYDNCWSDVLVIILYLFVQREHPTGYYKTTPLCQNTPNNFTIKWTSKQELETTEHLPLGISLFTVYRNGIRLLGDGKRSHGKLPFVSESGSRITMLHCMQ